MNRTSAVHPIPTSAIWTPRDCSDLLATRPRKNSDPVWVLWLCEPKSGDNFPSPFAPNKASHLCIYIDGRQARPRRGVPEMNGSVVRASSGGKERRLPWSKGNCFDGCRMSQYMLLPIWGYYYRSLSTQGDRLGVFNE
ncbi:hypothetical protein V6Z98_006566 [Aspergillus fumigatus]